MSTEKTVKRKAPGKPKAIKTKKAKSKFHGLPCVIHVCIIMYNYIIHVSIIIQNQ